MKILLLFLSLILIGCGPKFKVGDCLQYKDTESWVGSSHPEIAKIIGIGNTHYHMTYLLLGYDIPLDFSDFGFVDRMKEKTECPK